MAGDKKDTQYLNQHKKKDTSNDYGSIGNESKVIFVIRAVEDLSFDA